MPVGPKSGILAQEVPNLIEGRLPGRTDLPDENLTANDCESSGLCDVYGNGSTHVSQELAQAF